ncbi:helix-turn-helix domain-containing protein [Granulicella sp. dw_53]|uniref:MarR family winged helix-turn-helix transcriptional regulator n=1 Tax=Granulicella sp. dw_53 TaxID=2719792 RepID=UPI001BD2B705|nr:helix-turn-helix domain-containing protein [Granulicella sp. dw_53]
MATRRNTAKSKLDERVKVLAEFRYLLRRFLSFSEEAAEAAGTSAQQYQLLQVVAAAPDGEQASISYIAERMVLRHNSAVELVGRAERSGLVSRTEDAADHRRALITLTADGQTLLERLVGSHWAELERQGPGLLEALGNLLTADVAVGGRDRSE